MMWMVTTGSWVPGELKATTIMPMVVSGNGVSQLVFTEPVPIIKQPKMVADVL